MAGLNKVRVQLLDTITGAVLQEVDVLTSADAVTFSDGQTFQQKLDSGLLKGATGAQGVQGIKGETGSTGAVGATGAKGETGTRGSVWYSGTLITGTSTTATTFSGSGITSALVNDQYFNTSTGNVYVCTIDGNANTAKWVYSICLKGATGATGAQGIQGAKGDVGATGATGETVRVGTTYATATQANLFFKLV